MPHTQPSSDFLSNYVAFAATMPEVPNLYNRWAAVMAVAVSLGKSFYLKRGHFNVYPNLYVMLIGSPGTGKGVTCGILQSLLRDSDYRAFAADKSSKEKFIQDLADGFDFKLDTDASDFWDQTLGAGSTKPAECFVLAEEFNDFIGTNNIEFIALLTKLWSYSGSYSNRLKTGRSVEIFEPCINLLGGNTHAGFAMAFPPEVVGQGFLARMLLIYGESTGKRVSFPKPPPEELKIKLVKELLLVKAKAHGEATLTARAIELLDDINQKWAGFKDDLRFQHYGSRRFTQLLKLCLIFAASRKSTEITEADVLAANTLLADTEDVMQKALGEFGKAKHADVNSKIMQALYEATAPVETNTLWKLTSNDLDSINDLAKILQNLQQADKIQHVKGVGKQNGWLPKITPRTRDKGHTSAKD